VKVLVTDKADAKALDRIRRAGHEVVEKVGLQGAELVEALNGAQALLVRGGTKVTGDVLRATTTLKVVVRAGNRSVALSYRLFAEGDKPCCPTGTKVRVLFRFDGEKLAPQTAIPPSAQRRAPA